MMIIDDAERKIANLEGAIWLRTHAVIRRQPDFRDALYGERVPQKLRSGATGDISVFM